MAVGTPTGRCVAPYRDVTVALKRVQLWADVVRVLANLSTICPMVAPDPPLPVLLASTSISCKVRRMGMAMSSQVLRNGFSSFARPSDSTIGRVLRSPVQGAYQPRRGRGAF